MELKNKYNKNEIKNKTNNNKKNADLFQHKNKLKSNTMDKIEKKIHLVKE